MEPSSAGAPLDALEAAELSNLVSIWNLEAKEESPTARQKLIETFAERLERSGLLSAEPVHDKPLCDLSRLVFAYAEWYATHHVEISASQDLVAACRGLASGNNTQTSGLPSILCQAAAAGPGSQPLLLELRDLMNEHELLDFARSKWKDVAPNASTLLYTGAPLYTCLPCLLLPDEILRRRRPAARAHQPMADRGFGHLGVRIRSRGRDPVRQRTLGHQARGPHDGRGGHTRRRTHAHSAPVPRAHTHTHTHTHMLTCVVREDIMR